MTFTIHVAGRSISVSVMNESTRKFCGDYLTDSVPDFSIAIQMNDIVYERDKAAREAILENSPVQTYSDAYLETLAVYRKVAELLPKHGTFLFHGSVIAVDGVGYLFTAKSGTGKSTHTRLWRELFGERAIMVNDDKPLLRVTDEGVFACGTPWNGKHKLGSNMEVPLKAICVLERDSSNHIEKVSYSEIYPILLQQSYRPADPAAMICVMQLLNQIKKHVSFYRLGCNMDPSAAVVAYEGMNERNA